MKKIIKCIVIACLLLGLISMTNLADASSSNISTPQAKTSSNDENLLELTGKYDSKAHSIKVKGVLSNVNYNWLRGIYLMDGQPKKLYYISQEDLIKQGNKFMYEYKIAKNSKPSSVFFSGNYDIIDGADVPLRDPAFLSVPVDPFDVNKIARQKTIEDIRKMEKSLTSKGVPQKKYEVLPSNKAPFKPGKLTNEYLEYALNTLKMSRYLANLPYKHLKIDAQLNENSQYGAVLIDSTKVVTNHPKKPAGMTDLFYKKAYESTSTSSICNWTNDLKLNIVTLIADNDQNSVKRLVHRQSLLNLDMNSVGFGQSGKAILIKREPFLVGIENSDIEWDYTSWPSEGYMPIEYFVDQNTGRMPDWSLSLNPEKYRVADPKKVIVEVKQKNNSKKWRLTTAVNKSNSGNYLSVTKNDDSDGDFIVLRPALKTSLKNNDVFEIKVSGLKNANGKSTTLSYNVKFFNMKK